MTPEEINIACADIIGLFRIAPLRRETRKGRVDPNGVVLWFCDNDHGGTKEYARLPDFCNSLDACRKLEDSLSKEVTSGMFSDEVSRYSWHLVSITTDGKCHSCTPAMMASPKQKCEAFLKTHWRWIP